MRSLRKKTSKQAVSQDAAYCYNYDWTQGYHSWFL